MSGIVNRINALNADENTRRLPVARITGWLLHNGFLEERTDRFGKNKRIVTEAGKGIGIYQEERDSPHGKFLATFYTENAQHFIIDNLEAIIAD